MEESPENPSSSDNANILSRVRFKDPAETADHQEFLSQTRREPGNDEGSAVSALGVVKDSKQAWLVCLAAFFIPVLIVGVFNIFGVYFVAFLKEFQCTTVEAGKLLLWDTCTSMVPSLFE